MKTKVIFICLCLIASLSLSAQSSGGRAFLLKEFTKGKAYYKKGGASSSKFNYDVIDQKMLFLDDKDELMDLLTPSDFSSIVIGDRTFVYAKGGAFYEKVPIADSFLYIKWTGQIFRKTVGAYGQTSETSALSYVDEVFMNDNSKVGLEVDDNTNIVQLTSQYYLRIKNSYKDFRSFDALAKLFREHDVKIKEFVASNQLSFKNIEDVKSAVAYCYELSPE